METWLDPSIPDSAIVPEGVSIHGQDQTIQSGKSKGADVCRHLQMYRRRRTKDYCTDITESEALDGDGEIL